MNAHHLTTRVAILAAAFLTHASNTAAPATEPAGNVAMTDFLSRESRRLDATFLSGVTNRESFEAHQQQVRRDYLETLGLWPLPERTPLKAQTTRILEREEGFRVENVHFQSRPRLYVTGNLYLPRHSRAGDQLPAVLYVCGHSGHGRDGNKFSFQHHGMWFATHGYACLVIDTLQLGEIEGIHHGTYRYGRWWWQSRGYTPAAVECWNGIRALDYLQSRPEVDPARLAVTGISGGGAATFWIAAADDRVKVAVPVSGMSDLEDYVAGRVVNGHCDCMFCLNTFRWPWTDIAALVAPRPLLFANSGHDTIFPMSGNDRIRARLETVYSFYTNRTDRLFDIGVVPGGHDDKPELRLLAYRWINRHLKGDDSPVTEPALQPFASPALRAFPGDLPADQLNTRIDEVFVAPAANQSRPTQPAEFSGWRDTTLKELDRLVYGGAKPEFPASPAFDPLATKPAQGTVASDPGVHVPWRFLPAERQQRSPVLWVVVLDEAEDLSTRPAWLDSIATGAATLLVAPRGTKAFPIADPAPYYFRRALPLVGRTLDSCRLVDVAAAVKMASQSKAGQKGRVRLQIAGRGTAGVLGAYAALNTPHVTGVAVIDPPASHRDGPIFLNVLRVLDIPEALGLLAPRELTLRAPDSFQVTADLYQAAGAGAALHRLP